MDEEITERKQQKGTFLSFFKRILFSIVNLVSFFFPAKLQTEHIQIRSKHLPVNIQALKLIQLTDFHWDSQPIRCTSHLMEEVIEKVNKEDADLILLTGDYVQSQPEPIEEFVSNYLSRLRSKFGVYAILGNHDYKKTRSCDLISKTLTRGGIRVLRNETAKVTKGIEIWGLGDLQSGDFHLDKIVNSLNGKRERNVPFRICLSHNPDGAEFLAQQETHLVLSGHTHGGQVCLPGGYPVVALLSKWMPRRLVKYLPRKFYARIYHVVHNWDWGKGRQDIPRKDGGLLTLYTSRGLATHPPLRLFCDPEITVFHVRR